MKKIEIKTVKEAEDIHYEYEAADGSRFQDANECLMYDQSALCLVKSKLNFLGKSTIFGLLDEGSDECEVEIIDCQTEEDADNIFMYANLVVGNIDFNYVNRKRMHIGKPIILFFGYNHESVRMVNDGTIEGYLKAISERYNNIQDDIKEMITRVDNFLAL